MENGDKPMDRLTHEPLPLRLAPRCLAKTRAGTPCQRAAAKGKGVAGCTARAPGSGAPTGERNGMYKHGLWTAEAISERRAVRALLKAAKGTLSAI